MARMLDRKAHAEIVRKHLTPDEAMAFSICFGDVQPEGKFTRKWAARTVRDCCEANVTGKMALWAMQCDNLDRIMDVADFMVPKAPRQDSVTLKGDAANPVMSETKHVIDGFQPEALLAALLKQKKDDGKGSCGSDA